MKFKVSQESLSLATQTVQNIVSSKATLPILSNILLDLKKSNLRLNATDLDIGISCEIPVETVEEGAITIPAKKFSDIIKEMPSGDILIHAKKNNLIDIEGEGCRFKMNGLASEEFPKFPEFKDKEVIRIDQSLLKNMLNLTSFAVSHEESRYVLNGVLLEISGDKMCMVATDGRRLAKIEKKINTTIQNDISVIIPTKAIQEISRNLKEEGAVSIVIGMNQVLFDIEGVLIATRIIEGEFPNYNQVIPEPVKNRITMNTQELLSSIRRANLLATPDFQAIKFEVFSDKMVVSKTTPDVGESREEISIKYGGPEMVVGFNPAFLMDFLSAISLITLLTTSLILSIIDPSTFKWSHYIIRKFV